MKHWNKEIAKKVNPQITIKITKEDVVGILSSAFNGGIGYWGKEKPNDKTYEKTRDWLRKNAEPDYDDGEICYEEILAQMLFDGHLIPIIDNEDESEDFWLSLSNLVVGIQRAFRDGYYTSYKWLVPDGDGFGEWHLETSQIDSEVADVIIQLAVLGEVVYG